MLVVRGEYIIVRKVNFMVQDLVNQAALEYESSAFQSGNIVDRKHLRIG